MKILWVFFFCGGGGGGGGVITKLDYILGSFLYIRGFFYVKVQNLGIFLGLLKFQIFFFWVLEIPDIFWG